MRAVITGDAELTRRNKLDVGDAFDFGL